MVEGRPVCVFFFLFFLDFCQFVYFGHTGLKLCFTAYFKMLSLGCI